MEQFSWDPTVADDLKKEYKSKCCRCITNMIHKVATEPEYKTEWMSKTIRDAIKKTSTINFKKSEHCRRNHFGKNGDHRTHCQGSISSDYLKKKWLLNSKLIIKNKYDNAIEYLAFYNHFVFFHASCLYIDGRVET